MFKKFFSEEPQEARVEAAFDRAELKTLIDYFPIGKKPRYFPEFRREIVFHTIILAYRVNDHYLYTRDAVLLDDEGFPTGFLLENDEVLLLADMKRFHILLPDTTEMEKKLSYFVRADLGRAGQFGQGNTITLAAETELRGIPTIDTRVERRQIMNVGPFGHSSTILLTPDLSSFAITDKRRRQRVSSDVAADLFVSKDQPPYRCVLGDFSDAALSLRIIEGQPVIPAVKKNEAVIVEFNLGDVDSSYRLKGKVFRRVDEFCVVTLEWIYWGGEFQKIKMMDIMEIKTGLLNRNS